VTATSPRPSEPDAVDVLAHPDAVRTFLDAHARGRLVALRTSGSTAAPRSVLRTTASWVDSFSTVAELTSLGARSRVWLPGPLSSTMNLFAAVLCQHLGAEVVEGPTQATHAHLTPLLLERALAGGGSLRGVHATVAGERLHRSLRDRAVAAGAVVSHYYGSAEQSFVAWGTHADDLRPFPGVQVEVRDGDIWSRSPFTCHGYAGTPGPMRADPHGWVTVGDRGRLAGGTLQVLGRGGSAISTGGATVLVADVEPVLRAVATGQVVVLGVPHPALGQVVAAVLTERDDLQRMRRAAEKCLEPVQRPRLWFHVPLLPQTPAGKIDRERLVEVLTSPAAERLTRR
jgi:acyl-CoA synthetase (AMP-forming)/AMP-acid ligase II